MHTLPKIPAIVIEDAVRRALLEDLGHGGDLTSSSVVATTQRAEVAFVARDDGVIAGLDVARSVLRLVDETLQISVRSGDGGGVSRGQVIATVEGRAQSILSAERVCLNFLGHLSGIATATHRLVEAIAGTRARICCTRKTTPGLRALEKYAVLAGGGSNHRFGLSDAVLIKDNHIAMAGGITAALKAASQSAGHMTVIEIEVDRMDQLEEALAAGATRILLDNMTLGDLKNAVSFCDGKALLEASGGIKIDCVRAIADTGVDYISSGWITHSAPCLDIGLDFIGLTSHVSANDPIS